MDLIRKISKIHGAMEQYLIRLSYQILKMQEIISEDDEPVDIIQNLNLQTIFESYAWPIIDYEHEIEEEEIEKQQTEGWKTKLSIVTPSVKSKTTSRNTNEYIPL